MEGLSVVLPIFNEEKYLPTCLESFANQTYKNFEIIAVVDVRTNDRSVDILRYYSGILPIRILYSQPGKLYARHIGIVNSNYDIIVAVDGDCYYPPTFLEDIYRKFNKGNYIALCGWTYHEVPFFLLKIWYGSRLSGRSSAFLKEGYFMIGGFNFDIDQFNAYSLVMEEEVNFKRRLERMGKIGWIDTPCYHLRESSDFHRIEIRPATT